MPFAPDLQSWSATRRSRPTGLRIGTDVIGNTAAGGTPTFNAAFSLSGQTLLLAVPEPPAWSLLVLGVFALLAGLRSARRALRRG